jgi:quercetin dioxygenase-like cupin family protein
MKRLTDRIFLSRFLISLGVLGLSCAHLQAEVTQVITMIKPSQIQWKDGPKSLPKGAQYAVLAGDPSKPGLFSMRIKLPANYRVPAHFHTTTDNITVISGTVNFVYGDKLDKRKNLYKSGSFVSIPANESHFGWTGDSGAIVQLNNQGPWELEFVDPKTNARKQ